MQDLLYSCAGGIFVAFGIIIFLSYNPGKPFDYSTGQYVDYPISSAESNKKQDSDGNKENGEMLRKLQNMSEEDLVKRTGSLQKFLGLSEDDVRKAVRKTKDSATSDANNSDNFTSWIKMLDWAVFLFAIVFIVFLINQQTNGDFARILAGIFPREFEALGLKARIEKISEQEL